MHKHSWGAEHSFMLKIGNGTCRVQFTYTATWDLTCKPTCCWLWSVCFKIRVVNVICSVSLESTNWNISCFGKDKVLFLFCLLLSVFQKIDLMVHHRVKFIPVRSGTAYTKKVFFLWAGGSQEAGRSKERNTAGHCGCGGVITGTWFWRFWATVSPSEDMEDTKLAVLSSV